jgi:hypothetical protein
VLYNIINTDDPHFNEGEITQANKVWHSEDADKKHDDAIRDLGQRFIKLDVPTVLSPSEYYGDLTAETLINRPVMPVSVSTSHIKVGDDDFVLLTGIPTGAKFRIMAGTTEYQSGQLDANGTEIELSVPVPCSCKILIDKWPYQPFTATVEVHA